ncbi:hypothetical protein [Heyndrickxia ginsengihumi]|uniref:hypothetical protein n=1 Tax=Heyndrickxia ginsengihumi TaxID=363870 RepID=UPI00203DD26E|nr:hypothetical protein [Heyndrickxia ginsengihumi]MCM3022330.1 hypothetical protein [Heyndrickxia ginsengihumi]
MKKAVGYLKCNKSLKDIDSELHQTEIEGFWEICKAKNIEMAEIYVDFPFEGEYLFIGAKNMVMDIKTKKHGKIDYMIILISGDYQIIGSKDVEIITKDIVFSGSPIKGDKVPYSQVRHELLKQIVTQS